jgi:putative PIN family toxin of toxin-antitoxin system
MSTGAVLVIDTNIVLDCFVFSDLAAKPVVQGLQSGEFDWISTQAMRDELARVLDYPQIVPRLNYYKLSANNVLAAFDQYARLVDVAPKAMLNCRDADDQKFIDLAISHKAVLLSKDKDVMNMQKRLLAYGVQAQRAL